jgi:hypothetical protein
MLGNRRLAQPQRLDQLVDRTLVGPEQVEDLPPVGSASTSNTT